MPDAGLLPIRDQTPGRCWYYMSTGADHILKIQIMVSGHWQTKADLLTLQYR